MEQQQKAVENNFHQSDYIVYPKAIHTYTNKYKGNLWSSNEEIICEW